VALKPTSAARAEELRRAVTEAGEKLAAEMTERHFEVLRAWAREQHAEGDRP
jgi:hypothetical protein